MGQLLLFIVVALTVAAIVFGVTVMVSGGDPGLTPVEPDGRALPLPGDRPLGEEDVVSARFDTALRGYRMAQVDQALQRAAYDIGYKGELIGVLEAEVAALREGRTADADVLRRAREAAVQPPLPEPAVVVPAVDPAPVALESATEPITVAPAGSASADDTVGPAVAVAEVPPAAVAAPAANVPPAAVAAPADLPPGAVPTPGAAVPPPGAAVSPPAAAVPPPGAAVPPTGGGLRGANSADRSDDEVPVERR
jgi:DivIVA domain-containing protein